VIKNSKKEKKKEMDIEQLTVRKKIYTSKKEKQVLPQKSWLGNL
jgi:hypothetical protein